MEPNPAVVLLDEPQWLNPVQLGTETLRRRATEPTTLAAVRSVLQRLVPDPFIDFIQRYYALGEERFGSSWGLLDQLTLLHAAASLVRPRHYLEVGVFRGRSLAVVASAAPECELHGFDLWVQGYAGLDNVGPELVREQLRRVGHRGPVELISGSSHESLPAFLAAHPDVCFDLVTVDGDHTEGGARRDLETVLPRVAVGGVVIFDDLRHPKCPWLERVWDEVVGGHPAFAVAKFTEIGHGVGFAVRRGESRREIEALSGSGSDRLRRLAELLEEERAARDERLETSEADRARRLEIIERQGHEIGQLTAERNVLRAERDELLARLQSSEEARAQPLETTGDRSALEAACDDLRARLQTSEEDRARRLEIIERQGDELGQVTAARNLLEAERDDLRARLQSSEEDRAQRLEIIERQGDELGQVTAARNLLEAERDDLRARLQSSEEDRAQRLEIIERQGDELGRLQGERDDLRARLQSSEEDRARRLEIIQRQGDELGRLQGERDELDRRLQATEAERTRLASLLAAVGESVAELRALAGNTMAGLLGPRKIKRLATQLEALAARLVPRRGGSPDSRAA